MLEEDGVGLVPFVAEGVDDDVFEIDGVFDPDSEAELVVLGVVL